MANRGRQIKCDQTGDVFISIIQAARWLAWQNGHKPTKPITCTSSVYVDLVRHINHNRQHRGTIHYSIYGYSFTALDDKPDKKQNRSYYKPSVSRTIIHNETGDIYKNVTSVLTNMYPEYYLEKTKQYVNHDATRSYLARVIRGLVKPSEKFVRTTMKGQTFTPNKGTTLDFDIKKVILKKELIKGDK